MPLLPTLRSRINCQRIVPCPISATKRRERGGEEKELLSSSNLPPVVSGIMGFRLVYVLLVLVISCMFANAQSLESTDAMVGQIDMLAGNKQDQTIVRNDQVCTLCEEFVNQALYYISENKTQNEIISNLHKTCSRLHSLQQQCNLLVDYYAPLFFMEIAIIQPEKFCAKVDLCKKVMTVHQSDSPCTLCHNAISEMLDKLQDPDTKLELMRILLKACSKVENHVQECKKLVFEYLPLILVNAESFLEAKDVCTVLHICKESPEVVDGSLAAAA